MINLYDVKTLEDIKRHFPPPWPHTYMQAVELMVKELAARCRGKTELWASPDIIVAMDLFTSFNRIPKQTHSDVYCGDFNGVHVYCGTMDEGIVII